MGKMIQIRNVPEDLHRTLKSRAALQGQSLSDYLLREMERVASRPTNAEIRERLRALGPIDTDMTGEEAVAAIRAERDAQLAAARR